MDKTIGISSLRKSLASKIREVHEKGSRYIVLQRSEAKAILVSPEEIETLEIMADKDLLKDIKSAKDDMKKGRFSKFEDYFSENPDEE
jgi:PHD/YefM family antitoxin component YafN of YafNO toxin-antitoxin module